jgi:hypothetical protein
MVKDGTRAAKGGVKIVFDVPESSVNGVVTVVAAAGFTVGRYYPDHYQHEGGGGAELGAVRLGAEMPRTEFTAEEVERIVAAFDEVQIEAGFVCERQGTDTWEAGGGGDPGVREPRRPVAPVLDAAVEMSVPN